MGSDLTAARELGLFLRSRRERTTPRDLGLEPGPRRKVEGLRREEVAALAGLSTDYYQRLEQGRNVRPSDAVLDSIADALDLDEVERRHVMRLAQAARRPARLPSRTVDKVPRNTRLLLASMNLPAFVVTRHLDVLAWNDLAAALLGDPRGLPPDRRNVLFALFRHEEIGLQCPNWEATALDYIGALRAAVAFDPTHPRAVAIVGELSIRSPEFRRLWARHDVRENRGTQLIRHPQVGEIAFEWDAYPLPGEPGPMMIVMTPASGHEERLRFLKVVTEADGHAAPPSPARDDRRRRPAAPPP